MHIIKLFSQTKNYSDTFYIGLIAHCCEAKRLHFDVADALVVSVLQELHLVLHAVVAEGSVQTSLTFKLLMSENFYFLLRNAYKLKK